MTKKRHAKRRKLAHNVGMPPGHIAHRTNEMNGQDAGLSFIRYNSEAIDSVELKNIPEAKESVREDCVTWLQINSLDNTRLISETGALYSMHPMVLEDSTNLSHLPKMEEFNNQIYLTLKALNYNPEEEIVNDIHINLVLGDYYIVSMVEKVPEPFGIIRSMLNEDRGYLRKRKADYLFYRLIDVIVDDYFILLESLSAKIEDFEDSLANKPQKVQLNDIIHLKKQVVFTRRMILPLREQISTLSIKDLHVVSEETRNYFKDISDHLNHQASLCDSLLEMIKGLIDLHISNTNIITNNIMKTLTIITAVFIPLTFLTGIYGMNFHYMPGLEYKWSFTIMMSLMALVVLFMIYFMRRRKWF